MNTKPREYFIFELKKERESLKNEKNTLRGIRKLKKKINLDYEKSRRILIIQEASTICKISNLNQKIKAHKEKVKTRK